MSRKKQEKHRDTTHSGDSIGDRLVQMTVTVDEAALDRVWATLEIGQKADIISQFLTTECLTFVDFQMKVSGRDT